MTEDIQTKLPQPQRHKPSAALLIFLILPVLGVIAALVMVIINHNNQNPPTQIDTIDTFSPSLINYAAPDFNLTDLDGNPVSLSDYAGKPLLLNFWQTTCIPCEKELPAFTEFIESQDAVAVLAVNFDETPERVKAYFAEQHISGIPVAMDLDSTVRREYGVIGIPSTYAIDSDGLIRERHLGEMTLDDMQAFADLISNTSQ